MSTAAVCCNGSSSMCAQEPALVALVDALIGNMSRLEKLLKDPFWQQRLCERWWRTAVMPK